MAENEKQADTQAEDKVQAPDPGSARKIPASLLGRVKRTVRTKGKDGKWTEGQVAIKADEVLAWNVRGDEVVVVTRDGKKHRGPKE